MTSNAAGRTRPHYSRSSRGKTVDSIDITGERVRFFLLGTILGAAIGSLIASLLTQYVEHGDVLYPARVRLSHRGKRVNFELLLQ